MRTLKRLFDIFFSLLGLVFLSPLLCLSAIAIKMQDGGPVFFMQERIGKGLRPFKMYKFRSMTPETSGTGLSITIGGDARVTRFGRVLRKLKVDELPQLINVLKGDMSLVGPRPEVWKYVNHFISDFREVLKVRPGITDYASIIYHDEEEVLMKSDDPENFYLKTILPAKIELNKRYVREMSLVRDVDIIMRTFAALFQTRVSRCCRAFLARLGEFMGDTGKRFYTVKEFIITYRRFFVFFFHASAVVLANYAAFSILFEGRGAPEARHGRAVLGTARPGGPPAPI